MWGNSQIDPEILLETKPYLTKQEVSLLLQKNGKNLDKKISQLIKKGYLLPLKKGLYTTKAYMEKQIPLSREYLANVQYYPSYLSLEYVLQREGLIPETVYAYTSITLKPTQTFNNSLGSFIYRTIKNNLYMGYQSVRYNQNYRIKIASKAKALFDLLYLQPLPSTARGKRQVIADLRINWQAVEVDDLAEFQTYVDMSSSPKMQQVASQIQKLYDNS